MFKFLNQSPDSPGQTSTSNDTSNGSQIFSEQDIQDLVQNFGTILLNGKAEGSHWGPLVPSRVKDGLVRADSARAELHGLLETGLGRIQLTSLAERLDISEQSVEAFLLQKDADHGEFIFSADGSSILTKPEELKLVDETWKESHDQFIELDSFAIRTNISNSSVEKLFEKRCTGTNGPLLRIIHLNSTGEDDRIQRNSGGYVYSGETWSKMESTVMSKIKIAEDNKEKVIWSSTELLGLMPQHFMQLATELVKKLHEGDYGTFFDINPSTQTVDFTSRTYLFQQRDDIIADLRSGKSPFLRFEMISSWLSQLFPSVKDAHDYFESTFGENLESNTPMHVYADFTVSNAYVDGIAEEAFKCLSKEGSVNVKSVVVPEVCEAVPLISKRLHHLCYEAHLDTKSVGDYVLDHEWIQSLQKKSEETAIILVDEHWEQEEQPKLRSSAIISQLRDRMGEEYAKDAELWNLLWADKDVQLVASTQSVISERWNDLENQNDSQFITMWRSRVVDKSRLYSVGVQGLEEGSLKTQLTELLQTHITQELVPQTIARAKAKRLLKGSKRKISSRLSKLQSSEVSVREVEKFNEKIEIPTYTDEELLSVKKKHLSDMAQAMQKDKDSARMFLTLVIMFIASSHEGLVYATGKYAPRLLKLMKGSLEAERLQKLEQLKDAVKAGSITDEMRDDMRIIAANSIK